MSPETNRRNGVMKKIALCLILAAVSTAAFAQETTAPEVLSDMAEWINAIK